MKIKIPRKLPFTIAISMLTAILITLWSFTGSNKNSAPSLDLSVRNAHAAVCYLTHESHEDGSSFKYCHYECLGGGYILTVDITTLCPLTITDREER